MDEQDYQKAGNADQATPSPSLPFPKVKLTSRSIRQIATIVVVATLVAVVAGAGFWLSTPPYRALFNGQSESTLAEVVERLDKLAIDYQIDETSGVVKVPADQVHRVRLQLAAEGLPRSANAGFELLDEADSFGTSEFMERARYQRALEGELARSVMTIGAVRRARVHLALSKQSLFVRDRQPPSASVLVDLQPRRVLDDAQVQAIANLVSSSVPKLTSQRVTVVDQMGNLLSDRGPRSGLGFSNDQLQYTQKLEAHYIRRIEEILSPILGLGNVRAQVTVEADFSTTEETEELYDDSGSPRVRSEQLHAERSARGPASGIPGALSNQPPEPTRLKDVTEQAPASEEAQDSAPAFERSETTRNYELDKRIRHTRRTPGTIRRVTAAVVIAHPGQSEEAGEAASGPLSGVRLERITELVHEAVGFDAERGDRVTVVAASFAESPFAIESGAENWWESEWFLNLVKMGVFLVVVLVVATMVVRPLIRGFVVRVQEPRLATSANAKLPSLPKGDETGEGRLLGGIEEQVDDDVVRLSNARPLDADYPTDLNGRVQRVRDLISDDPRRAVQVVKHWVSNDV